MEGKLQGRHRGKFKIRTNFTLGSLSLKELVDEAKETERKKIRKNLKSKIPNFCSFPWSPWNPKLLEHPKEVKRAFSVFRPSVAPQETMLYHR